MINEFDAGVMKHKNHFIKKYFQNFFNFFRKIKKFYSVNFLWINGEKSFPFVNYFWMNVEITFHMVNLPQLWLRNILCGQITQIVVKKLSIFNVEITFYMVNLPELW